MFCEQCGNQLNGTERFCPACGTPVHQNASAQPQSPQANVPPFAKSPCVPPTAKPVPHRPVTQGTSYAMRSLNRTEPAKRVVRPTVSARPAVSTPSPANTPPPTNAQPPASTQSTTTAQSTTSAQHRPVTEADEVVRKIDLYRSTHGSYLPFAIIVTLFCCIPFGIIAIIMTCSEANCLARGDIAGAAQAHGSAQLWCWLAVGAGLLTMFFVLPNILSMPWFFFLLL